MKITNGDYQTLEWGIRVVQAKNPDVTYASYELAGLSPIRYRWDALNASGLNIQRFYTYLNDSHIDTALRRIMGAL